MLDFFDAPDLVAVDDEVPQFVGGVEPGSCPVVLVGAEYDDGSAQYDTSASAGSAWLTFSRWAFLTTCSSTTPSWKSLRLVPLDRLLLETDHPFGDRSESPPRCPGNLSKSESAVSAAFSVSPDALRHRTWRNLKAISEKLNLVEMFPREFQVQFLAV